MLLAETLGIVGKKPEALKMYEIMIRHKESLFRETLLSFSVSEKFNLNKRIADLYD